MVLGIRQPPARLGVTDGKDLPVGGDRVPFLLQGHIKAFADRFIRYSGIRVDAIDDFLPNWLKRQIGSLTIRKTERTGAFRTEGLALLGFDNDPGRVADSHRHFLHPPAIAVGSWLPESDLNINFPFLMHGLAGWFSWKFFTVNGVPIDRFISHDVDIAEPNYSHPVKFR